MRARDKKGEPPTARVQVLIILIIAVAIILAIFLSNQAYNDTKKRATDDFNQQQLRSARSIATSIENYIINVEDDLHGLSELSAVQRMEPGIQEDMKALYIGFPLKTSLRRLDKNGTLRFIYPNESWRMELVGQAYPDDAYFQKAKDTGDTVISGLIINEIGEMRIRLVRPVYIMDEKGHMEFNGVIIASIDPKVMAEMYITPVVSGKTGYAWLLNEEGIFLAHYEEEFVGRDAFKAREEKNPLLSYETINKIQRQMMAGEDGIDRYVSGWHRGRTEKVEKFIAYAPVRIGDHIWSVAMCAPIEEMNWIIANRHPRELFILSYIIILLIAGGSFFVISERRKKSILEHEVRRQTKELRESEAEYRSLVESTEDSVYLVDRNCQYLFMNEKHLSRLGLSKDKIIGRAYRELHTEEETKKLSEIVNRVFDTGNSVQQEHKSHRDSRHFLRTLSPIKDHEGKITAVTVVSKDITGLKRTEEELIETKEYLDNIIKSSADPITIVDMGGIVRDWNKGAESLMGYCADEVIGTSVRKFFAVPEEADRIMERVQKEGKIKNYRAIVLRKDEKPIHICMSTALLKNKEGVPIGTVRVSRDITKEVELEEKIREERDNLNTIFETMTDGVYLVSKDYKIEFMNRVLQDEYGDRVGSICYKAFHEREQKCPMCKITEVMNGKTVRWIWHSDRENKIYDLIEMPLSNEDGTISKLTIFRDISEYERAKEQIEASLKEKEVMLKEIHHRVKNNMQVISSILNLHSKHANDKQAKELFQDSRNRILSMALIHDKLYKSEDLARINFAEYVRSLVSYLSRVYRIKPGAISVDMNINDVLLDVNIAIPCGLIINELVSNSFKHAFPDGREGVVTIAIHPVEENGIELVVSDDGVGFPEDLDYRKTRTIGMELVTALIKQLDGTIEFDRSDGTTFRIKFRR